MGKTHAEMFTVKWFFFSTVGMRKKIRVSVTEYPYEHEERYESHCEQRNHRFEYESAG